MNIFFLDADPRKNARYHCDKHVSKMAQELVQMFASNAAVQASECIFNAKGNLHKGGYPTHPMTIWLHSSLSNAEHGKQLLASLVLECKIRGYKTDTYENQLAQIRQLPDSLFDGKPIEMTPIPLCMPNYIVDAHQLAISADIDFNTAEQRYYANNLDSAVQAYRQYYICEKAYFARWAHSIAPAWWPGNHEPYNVFPAGALYCNIGDNAKNAYLLDFILQIQERAEELTAVHDGLMAQIPQTKKRTPRAKHKTTAVAIGPIDELRNKIKQTLGNKNIPQRRLIERWLNGEDLRGYSNADERADAHIAYWVRERAKA